MEFLWPETRTGTCNAPADGVRVSGGFPGKRDGGISAEAARRGPQTVLPDLHISRASLVISKASGRPSDPLRAAYE